ncbi:MAG TPA: peptidoglycan-binding domain-containing protein [Acetobacteraceae bacterium]
MTGLTGAALAGCIALSGAGAASAQTVQLTFVQPLSTQSTVMVQQRLRQAGDYAGNIDGAWGPDSVVALQRFQASHGLQPSGQLNEPTAMALGLEPTSLFGAPPVIANTAPTYVAPPASVPAPVQTLSPRGVAAVQGRLRDLGFYRGPIDGVWGAGTQQAIATFQQGRGLEPNGQINPATAGALGLNQSWLFAGG